VRTDLSALGRLEKLTAQPARLLDQASRVLSQETVTLIQRGFTAQRSPYGRRWRPKKRPDGRKTLHGPTGRLRTTYRPLGVSTLGFKVDTAAFYARFHQSGTSRMVARKMVPDGRGIPGPWRKGFKLRAREDFESYYLGRRARVDRAPIFALT